MVPKPDITLQNHLSKFTKTKFLIKCAIQNRSLIECIKLDIFLGSWNLQMKSIFYFKLLNQTVIIYLIKTYLNWLPLIQKSLTVSLIWEFLGRFLCITNLFFKLSTGSRPEYLFFFFQIASEILLNIFNMLGPSKLFVRVCSFRHPEIPRTAKSIHDCIYRIRSAFLLFFCNKPKIKIPVQIKSFFLFSF